MPMRMVMTQSLEVLLVDSLLLTIFSDRVEILGTSSIISKTHNKSQKELLQTFESVFPERGARTLTLG